MSNTGKELLAKATHDTKALRELAKRLAIHAHHHVICGYDADQGIVPDTAALLLEALADLLEESPADGRTDKG